MPMIGGVVGGHCVRLDRIKWVMLALLIFVAGCASAPPPPKPTALKATLWASTNSNPDVSRRASPLVVRVYELRSSAAFDSADFVSIYDRDQATLGSEMAGREEFVLRPGDSKSWEKATSNDVRFIGVVAAFRDIERARWKTLIPIKSNANNIITVKVDEITLSASVATQ